MSKARMVMVPHLRIVEQLLNHVDSIVLIDEHLQIMPSCTTNMTEDEIAKLEQFNELLEVERNDLTVEILTLGEFLRQHMGEEYIEVDLDRALDNGWLDWS